MKGIQESFCRAIMSNSSPAVTACICPVTTTPAVSLVFNRPSICLVTGSAKEDKTNSDPLTVDDHGVVRTGDSPFDTQGQEPGAREPGWFTTPQNSYRSLYEVTLPMYGQTESPPSVHSSLPMDKKSGNPLSTTNDWHGSTWQESKLRSATFRAMTDALVAHRVSPCMDQELSHNVWDEDHSVAISSANQDESISISSASYRNPVLLVDGVIAKSLKIEGENVERRPLKPNDLSEIERQRGPIKKRHYQPDALDLSTKRSKSKEDIQSSQSEGVAAAREMFQKQLRLSSEQEQARSENTSGHGNTNLSPRPRVLLVQELFQKRHSTSVKQESEDNSALGAIRGVPPMSGQTERKCTFAGVADLDQKPVSVRGNQLVNQTSNNATNSNSTTNLLVPLVPSTEVMTKWVLHVIQSNGMFAMQHLHAKLSADSNDLTHSPACHVNCHGSVTSLPTLKDVGHRDAPPSQKPYACEHCSSRFKHRHHVIRHMRAHNGERPFHCEHCGATFARKCVLTNHRRTHTGEKPYICSECGDTFSRKHHLVIHQRTHSGEKPYQCRDCGAAFARSHHVNRHRKTHAKEHEIDATTGDTNLHSPTSSVLSIFKSDAMDSADKELIESGASLRRNLTSTRISETVDGVYNSPESLSKPLPSAIKL